MNVTQLHVSINVCHALLYKLLWLDRPHVATIWRYKGPLITYQWAFTIMCAIRSPHTNIAHAIFKHIFTTIECIK